MEHGVSFGHFVALKPITYMSKNPLLAVDTNAKTRKGQAKGFMTGILYLAPANISGKNLCPHASVGCKAACLFTAGRGAMSPFLSDRKAFAETIKDEIAKLVKKTSKNGMTPCIRLNGTSDIPWHKVENIIQSFPNVQFYDYTPNLFRMLEFTQGKLPANYHLTFSRKEDNDQAVDSVLKAGGNVAVVFKTIPTSWKGFPVVDGDETDLRFLDGKNVIVGLKAKGQAKKDTSGFVI
jgi:hypothetical protein